MNLNGLDYGLLFTFKVCVEAKSFSKASEILHVKQPAISYCIKKLEELLNVNLFDRGNYGIKLTEEGRILYEYVTEANNNIVSGLQIISEVSSKEISEIKIGVSLNIAMNTLMDSIKELRELFPNIKISIYTKNEESMLRDLQDKKLDVVIFSSYKENTINGIKIRKIKNNEVVCVGSKKYKDIFDKNDFKETIPLILPGSANNLGRELETARDNKFIKESIYCYSALVGKELLLSGLGIGYINKEIINDELKDKKLYILFPNNYIGAYSINIASQDKNLNVVVKKFIKIFIREVVDK